MPRTPGALSSHELPGFELAGRVELDVERTHVVGRARAMPRSVPARLSSGQAPGSAG